MFHLEPSRFNPSDARAVAFEIEIKKRDEKEERGEGERERERGPITGRIGRFRNASRGFFLFCWRSPIRRREFRNPVPRRGLFLACFLSGHFAILIRPEAGGSRVRLSSCADLAAALFFTSTVRVLTRQRIG